MRLRVDDERVRIGMRAWMQTDAAPVEARVAFRREDGNGRGYFAANQVDLSAWSPLLHAAGVTVADGSGRIEARSEEHTSELQSLMRISYADFCLKNKKKQ